MSNSFNVPEINQEQAQNLLKFFIKSRNNILLFGRRGTGKTEMALQAIKECKLKLNYINLSVMERCDLGGYPDINAPGDTITFKSPWFLPKLQNDTIPDTVILFDEVDKCSPEITAPLLEILQFRKINGVPINAAACILTSNLINEGTYNNVISSAILDRTSKYILSFDFNQWVDWAKANNIHDIILGFLRSNPEFSCGKIEDLTYASPSPRSWTWASQALIKAKELKMADLESVSQIISGYVGYEAGLRFKIWYEYYHQFEPHVRSLIERGEMALNFSSLVPTEKLVLVISACYYAKQMVLTEKSAKKFVYLERLCNFFNQYKVDPEVQVMGMYNSFDFDLIEKKKLYECKIFFDHFTKLSDGVKFNK